MTTVRRSRAVASFLLRIADVRLEKDRRDYELLELRTGVIRRFSSLRALERHLQATAAGSGDRPAKQRRLRLK